MPFGEDLNVGVGNRTGDTGLKYSMPGDNVRQKFTGYQKDNETQLDFAEARMYENRYGRFTAVDPLLASGKSANPQTFNRYSYTSNNPIDRIDPNGKDWFCVRTLVLTYGKPYYRWTPVWRNATASGDSAWKSGVYQIHAGKHKGMWAALDPWNDRYSVALTRESAEKAYNNYRTQTRDDVLGGSVRAVAQTFDSISPGIGLLKPHEGAADTILNTAGIRADENSDLFRVANMGTKAIIALLAASATEAAAARNVSTEIELSIVDNYLRRPYVRVGVRNTVELAAPTGLNGEFLDANKFTPIQGKYHLGHKYGFEYWRLRDAAQKRGLTQSEFNDLLNIADIYQIEDPSHQFEKPKP